MATIKITQRAKTLSNGLFPIYLRITIDRKSKFISLNLSCEKTQWNEVKSEFRKSFSNYKQMNGVLIELKSRAEKLITDHISKGTELSLEQFEDMFLNYKKNKIKNLNDFWQEHINDLLTVGRTGTARYYKDSKMSFFKFLENKTVYFKDITPLLLDKYQVFLQSNGNSESGVAIKMRAVRALYNDAIKKGFAKKENYPFDVYKVSKLKSKPDKRALKYDEVQKIKNIDLSNHQN